MLRPGIYFVTFGNNDGTITYTRTVRDSPQATVITDSDGNVTTGASWRSTCPSARTTTSSTRDWMSPSRWATASIYDVDADGVQDAGEPGIVGAAVKVVWLGPNAALGGGDDQTFNTTTRADGIWSVSNLPPGSYQVTATPTAAGGFNTLTDSIDNNVLSATNPVIVSTTSGVNRSDVDFGFRGTASIGDLVWHDLDGDGTQDSGEPGIPNVSVTVTWLGSNGVPGGDDVAFTVTTNASGLYSVGNLPAGNYVVSVDPATLPDNASPTFDLDGTATAHTAATTLTSGQARTDVDFGYRGNGTIGDRIWYDVDGDGVQDAGEPGLAGVSVTLTFGGDDGNLATTADNLTYNRQRRQRHLHLRQPVRRRPNGTDPNYRITVTPPTGYPTQTFDADGLASANQSSLQLAGGATNLLQDFGYRGPATQCWRFLLGGRQRQRQAGQRRGRHQRGHDRAVRCDRYKSPREHADGG